MFQIGDMGDKGEMSEIWQMIEMSTMGDRVDIYNISVNSWQCNGFTFIPSLLLMTRCK